MNADGGGRRRLTRIPALNTSPGWAPAWSPDGRKLAYARKRGEYSDIYVMNDDGSGQERLTRTPGRSEEVPAWSPGQKN